MQKRALFGKKKFSFFVFVLLGLLSFNINFTKSFCKEKTDVHAQSEVAQDNHRLFGIHFILLADKKKDTDRKKENI